MMSMPPLPRSVLSVTSMYFRMLNPVTETWAFCRSSASGFVEMPRGRESNTPPSHGAPGYRIVNPSRGSRFDVYDSVSAGVHAFATYSGEVVIGRPSLIG